MTVILFLSLLLSIKAEYGLNILQNNEILESNHGYNHKTETLKKIYKPLCHSIKKVVEMGDNEFEYKPSMYTEYTCTRPERDDQIVTKDTHMCTFPGFECVQREAQVLFAKRRKGSETWEFYTETIDAECECMLPAIQLPLSNE